MISRVTKHVYNNYYDIIIPSNLWVIIRGLDQIIYNILSTNNLTAIFTS